MTQLYRQAAIVDDPGLEAQARRRPWDEAYLAATALPRAIGRLLASLRMGAGISTLRLAERIGRHQPQIVALELPRGGAPRLDTLERFVKGCDAELALVARDADGRLHAVGVTSDAFAEDLARRLDATAAPAVKAAARRADRASAPAEKPPEPGAARPPVGRKMRRRDGSALQAAVGKARP